MVAEDIQHTQKHHKVHREPTQRSYMSSIFAAAQPSAKHYLQLKAQVSDVLLWPNSKLPSLHLHSSPKEVHFASLAPWLLEAKVMAQIFHQQIR